MFNIVPFLDVTSLNADDSEQTIIALCDKAKTLENGPVAVVCVYPQFVALAARLLKNTGIKIATVSNFPIGQMKNNAVEIQQAIQNGADEIDWVLPYTDFLSGKNITESIKTIRAICNTVTLKVIIESGAYPNEEKIFEAALLVIEQGADFVKTSTGKIAQGASLLAAEAILNAIKISEKNVGIKISGGIKTYDQVMSYVHLCEKIMGPDWLTTAHFRIGCSRVPV